MITIIRGWEVIACKVNSLLWWCGYQLSVDGDEHKHPIWALIHFCVPQSWDAWDSQINWESRVSSGNWEWDGSIMKVFFVNTHTFSPSTDSSLVLPMRLHIIFVLRIQWKEGAGGRRGERVSFRPRPFIPIFVCDTDINIWKTINESDV